MRKLITISNPPSGMTIILCDEAVQILGGHGARIRVANIEFGDIQHGIAKFILIRDANRGTGRIQADGKFFITDSRVKATNPLIDMPRFGSIGIKWEPIENGISFLVPPHEQLPSPTPHPHVGGRRKLKSDPDTPHARLGAAVRLINELCASGLIDDVTFSVPANETSTKYFASNFRITAERTIRQTLS